MMWPKRGSGPGKSVSNGTFQLKKPPVYTFYKIFTEPKPPPTPLVRSISIGDTLKGDFWMGPFQITATHEQRYHDQHLDMDFEHKTAMLDTKPLRLTRKEYDLLSLLILNAGRSEEHTSELQSLRHLVC